MLFEASSGRRRAPLMEGLLDRRGSAAGRQADRAALSRRALRPRARRRRRRRPSTPTITLAYRADASAALMLRAELDAATDRADRATSSRSRTSHRAEEKASRFTALGDRYIELGDRATAREMYREALVYRPGDHLLLTKFLELVADDGDWSYSLDLVQRLIDTEQDPKVRARYRHTRRDDRARRAVRQRSRRHVARQGDRRRSDRRSRAADELEALLRAAGDRDALVRVLLPPSRARAQSRRVATASGCGCGISSASCASRIGRHDDALVAFEVAQSLAPDDERAPASGSRDLYVGDAGARQPRRSRSTKRCCAPTSGGSRRTRRCARCISDAASPKKRARATRRSPCSAGSTSA